ncbi:hypothetical protein [Maritimibacter fusiformis]|uniref:Uncharacterized protein n=1 Tax=Maritimibacter fusiformis TaxID=2603819 RepID=A0A5D0RQC6_9RHOB|nr:hypothetical protein [Maritimibacter fusiformis]TYB83299.1 hypothetical protein FVF75_03740 [Maritimibacter fusiformis]
MELDIGYPLESCANTIPPRSDAQLSFNCAQLSFSITRWAGGFDSMSQGVSAPATLAYIGDNSRFEG